ncbi:hypothetical protein Holit_02893 [Hollandina sp. SP2]
MGFPARKGIVIRGAQRFRTAREWAEFPGNTEPIAHTGKQESYDVLGTAGRLPCIEPSRSSTIRPIESYCMRL